MEEDLETIDLHIRNTTRSPQLETRNPQPATPNTKHQIPNTTISFELFLLPPSPT
jgi:hypothetical protein